MQFAVRRAVSGDEAALRALRLQALSDSPEAFGSTYERELARTHEEWQRWLVRSAMFPISRKQALNAQKMQELQPEMKRLAEKFKNNVEARTKAQQELFKKHNYNPLAGCLPVFLQLPIFMGLYRSLSVDVELRQAPLISESIRWCSNFCVLGRAEDASRHRDASGCNEHRHSGAQGPAFRDLPHAGASER